MGKNIRGWVSVFVFIFFFQISSVHAEFQVSLKNFLGYQLGRASGCVQALLSPKDATRLQALSQAAAQLKQLLQEEMHPTVLRQHLRAYYGSHHDVDEGGNPIKPYNMRPWDSVPLQSIQPNQVVGMSVEEFVAILLVSTEIEVPIHDYQAQSGKAFEYLLPSLARFMGRTPEQQEYSLTNGRGQKCDSVWCSEENRHGAIFARIIEKLSGNKPDLSHSAIPNITSDTEAGGLRHLSHRQGTEWGASAAYALLAIHSRGPLHDAIMNVFRDEVKHLVVVSGADVYLRGSVPNERTLRILEKTFIELKVGTRARTGGNSVFTNPFNLAEAGLAQLYIEAHMRPFLQSLPLNLLRAIYETQSQTSVPPSVPLNPEDEAQRELRLEQQRLKRHALFHWPRTQRAEALEQEDFERRYSDLIQRTLDENFNGYNQWRHITEHETLLNYVEARLGNSSLHFPSHHRLMKAVANRLFLKSILEPATGGSSI